MVQNRSVPVSHQPIDLRQTMASYIGPADPSTVLSQIVLETEHDNAAALSLYESLGFIREKRLYRFYLNVSPHCLEFALLHKQLATVLPFAVAPELTLTHLLMRSPFRSDLKQGKDA